jgi:hypothetical protein
VDAHGVRARWHEVNSIARCASSSAAGSCSCTTPSCRASPRWFAGEAVARSWWGHPKSHAMFHAATELGEHEDVLVEKLVAGKVTFVHRSLWPRCSRW